MLWTASALPGLTIEAQDGRIGTVKDLLLDEQSWQLRWLEVHAGPWLLGRNVLLPLSALGRPDRETHAFSVQLTRQQVKDSPAATTDLPVSRQLEAVLYAHYDWNPYWQTGFSIVANAVCTPVYMPVPVPPQAVRGDPHLRSARAMLGYHVEAQDGGIGHVEDFILDDAGWHVRHVVIAMKSWRSGRHVVVAPQMIQEIDWLGHDVRLRLDVAGVQASPTYDPDALQALAGRQQAVSLGGGKHRGGA